MFLNQSYVASPFERIGTADPDSFAAWGFFGVAMINFIVATVMRRLKHLSKERTVNSLHELAFAIIPVSSTPLIFWFMLYFPTVVGIISSVILFGVNLLAFYLRDALSASYESKLESLQAMLDSSPLACTVINKDFAVLDANMRVAELFELSGTHEYAENPFDLSPKNQPDGKPSREKAQAILADAFAKGRANCEWMHQTAKGEPIPCELIFVRVQLAGNPVIIQYIRDLREINSLVSMKEQMEKLAFSDDLTGLFNRRYFIDSANEDLKHCNKSGHPFSIIILDIDFFKKVNDTYGHGIGDEVLKIFASRIKETLRHGTIVARYGGEEFIVALSSANLENAAITADRILRNVGSKPFEIDEKLSIPITVSVGVATNVDSAMTLTDIITNADKALYQAKNDGRNRVVLSRS